MTSSSANNAADTSVDETALPESRISIARSTEQPLAGRVVLSSIQEVTERIEAAETEETCGSKEATNSSTAPIALTRTIPLIVRLPLPVMPAARLHAMRAP